MLDPHHREHVIILQQEIPVPVLLIMNAQVSVEVDSVATPKVIPKGVPDVPGKLMEIVERAMQTTTCLILPVCRVLLVNSVTRDLQLRLIVVIRMPVHTTHNAAIIRVREDSVAKTATTATACLRDAEYATQMGLVLIAIQTTRGMINGHVNHVLMVKTV